MEETKREREGLCFISMKTKCTDMRTRATGLTIARYLRHNYSRFNTRQISDLLPQHLCTLAFYRNITRVSVPDTTVALDLLYRAVVTYAHRIPAQKFRVICKYYGAANYMGIVTVSAGRLIYVGRYFTTVI